MIHSQASSAYRSAHIWMGDGSMKKLGTWLQHGDKVGGAWGSVGHGYTVCMGTQAWGHGWGMGTWSRVWDMDVALGQGFGIGTGLGMGT